MMSTPSSQRRLISFRDGKASCTRVKVEGDAVYCIQGPVCGASTEAYSKSTQAKCPTEGDAAIEQCTSKSRFYEAGCVAQVDAQCVSDGRDGWQCVFPDTNPEGSATKGTQVDIASSTNETTLSASTQESSTTSGTMGVSNASINIAVGVACCVLAFVGLVFAKKRRNRERLSSYSLSEKDISIVTL